MPRSDAAGWLLLASFALFFPVAVVPALVWMAPMNEELVFIAQRRRTWQAVNVSIGGAAVLLVLAWAGGLFLAWTALGNAAVVRSGMAILASGYAATWAGWAAVALGAVMLVQLVVTGDAIPALYHLAPAVIGVALQLD